MDESFDAYYKWLSIPPEEQPPNHYRLLGVRLFEEDADVIDNAANRQMSHIRTFQSGKYSAWSQRILNEISAARVCLLQVDQKAAYDAVLRQQQAPAPAAAPPRRPAPSAGSGIGRMAAEQRPVMVPSFEPTRAAPPAPAPPPSIPPAPTATNPRPASLLDPRWQCLLWVGAASAAVGLVAILLILLSPGPETMLVFDWSQAEREKVRVLVDGKHAEAPRQGTWKFKVSPGNRRVEAHRAGFEHWSTTVTIEEGQVAEVPPPSWTPLKKRDGIDPGLPPVGPPPLVEPANIPSGPGLMAQYYSDDKFESLLTTRVDSGIDGLYGLSHPSGISFPNDTFSVRWSGYLVPPEAGKYQLMGVADDRMVVMLDGKSPFEEFEFSEEKLVDIVLDTRPYKLSVAYVDLGNNAAAALRWVRPGAQRDEFIPRNCFFTTLAAARGQSPVLPPIWTTQRGGLSCEVFDGEKFETRRATMIEPTIDQFGRGGALFLNGPAINYSVRWSGSLLPPEAGKYRFVLLNDDGARVKVDGRVVVDDWRGHHCERHEFTLALTARPVPIEVEYFNGREHARCVLRWIPPGQSDPVPIPPECFSPQVPSKSPQPMPSTGAGEFIAADPLGSGQPAVPIVRVAPPSDAEWQQAQKSSMASLNAAEKTAESLLARSRSAKLEAERYALLRYAEQIALRREIPEFAAYLAVTKELEDRFSLPTAIARPSAIKAASLKIRTPQVFAPLRAELERAVSRARRMGDIDAAVALVDLYQEEITAIPRDDKNFLAPDRALFSNHGKDLRRRVSADVQRKKDKDDAQVRSLTENTTQANVEALAKQTQWDCFQLRSWGTVHQLLVVPSLREPVEAELKLRENLASAADVSDAWWKASASHTDLEQDSIRLHAAQFSQIALKTLTDPALCEAHQQRIDEAILIQMREAGQVTKLAPGDFIDLMPLADPRLSLMGDWTKAGGTLQTSMANHSRIAIPLRIQGGYEINLDFTRTAGNDCVGLYLPVGGSGVTIILHGWGGGATGLVMVKNARGEFREAIHGDALPGTFVRPGQLPLGRRQRLTAHVQQAGGTWVVRVALDGIPILAWSGKETMVQDDSCWTAGQNDFIKFGSHETNVTFHRAALRMDSGTATVIPRNPDGSLRGPRPAAGPSANIARLCVTDPATKRSYYISDKPLLFYEALQFAAAYKARLATISSREEADFVINLARGRSVWLAGWRGQRQASGTTWYDERFRPLSYFQWAPGEPGLSSGEQILGLDGPSRRMHDYHPRDPVPHALLEWGEEEAVPRSP